MLNEFYAINKSGIYQLDSDLNQWRKLSSWHASGKILVSKYRIFSGKLTTAINMNHPKFVNWFKKNYSYLEDDTVYDEKPVTVRDITRLVLSKSR